MTDTIAVFGAEDALGKSVVRGLAKRYNVKVITSSIRKTSCLEEIQNVTILHIDFSNSTKLLELLQGISGVFVTTNTDFNSTDGYNEEVNNGQLIANACSRAGVKHVILHTALSVVRILGLSARHMDAKCAIGEIMKRLNLPLTCIVTPCFYEELLQSPLKPRKLPTGSYSFEIAAGGCTLDWMSIEDVGAVVASIFQSGDDFLHKTLSLSANKLSVSEIAATMTRNLLPTSFVDKMMTVDAMRRQGYPGASDLANMFDFYCRVDQRSNIDLTKRLNPNLRTLQEWIQDNLALVKQAFDEESAIPGI